MKKRAAKKKVKIPRKVGRPLMFGTPAELEAKINKYFEECPDKTTAISDDGTVIVIPAPTISGLALYLGFCDRYSMWEYEQKPQFTSTIKKARARITNMYEAQLMRHSCTGAIFMLKNLGYRDKTEIESSGSLKVVTMPIIEVNGKPQTFNVGE